MERTSSPKHQDETLRGLSIQIDHSVNNGLCILGWEQDSLCLQQQFIEGVHLRLSTEMRMNPGKVNLYGIDVGPTTAAESEERSQSK